MNIDTEVKLTSPTECNRCYIKAKCTYLKLKLTDMNNINMKPISCMFQMIICNQFDYLMCVMFE